MNSELLKPEIQKFLEDHIDDSSQAIALKKSPFPGVLPRELAEQLDGRQRSAKKLPLWFKNSAIYYPSKLSMEQCSSEATAAYKAKLIKGDRVIDMTGGFGVDTFYFSKLAKEVIHCEQNRELSAIAKHNSKILGASNIQFAEGNSIEFLQGSDNRFDTLYIDPSRRVQSQKVFLLNDTEPNVTENLGLFLSRAKRIVIKTSPLYDIQSGLRELTNVSEIHILSIKNDCKELLWVIDKDYNDEPAVICAAFKDGEISTFSFNLSEEKALQISDYSGPIKYLYEPDVALLKSGAFKLIAKSYGLEKLHPHSHFYTSAERRKGFIGKTFCIYQVTEYKNFSKENLLKKANIIARNFPLSPEELKKKHKLSDGGEHFLIFTKVHPESLIVIEATLDKQRH